MQYSYWLNLRHVYHLQTIHLAQQCSTWHITDVVKHLTILEHLVKWRRNGALGILQKWRALGTAVEHIKQYWSTWWLGNALRKWRRDGTLYILEMWRAHARLTEHITVLEHLAHWWHHKALGSIGQLGKLELDATGDGWKYSRPRRPCHTCPGCSVAQCWKKQGHTGS